MILHQLSRLSRAVPYILCAAVLSLAVSASCARGQEWNFKGPFGIAIDSHDTVYVAEINNRRISKFTVDGKWVGSIDSIAGYGPLVGPFDVAIAPDGSIYIADTRAHKIIALDKNEKLRFVLGGETKGSAEGEFSEPHFVTVDRHGDLLVADTFNARIQKFSTDGKFIRTWGRVGDGPGEFLHHGYVARIDTDEQGFVYVREFDGGRIQKFTEDGQHVATFAKRGVGRGELDEGYGLKVIGEKLYCPDTFENRIQVFSLSGELLDVWAPGEGNEGAHFNHPVGIAGTSRGELVVTDWKNDRVLKLDKNGKLLQTFGRSQQDRLAWKPPTLIPRPPRKPVSFAVYAGVGDETIQRAKDAGVRTIYPSLDFQYQNWSLDAAVSRASTLGIEVHPSIACLPFGQGSRNSDVFERHPDWCMWKRGATEPMKTLLGWSNPAARSYRADHIVAEVKRTGVQGVMLDYIRYLGTDYGYDPLAIAEFKKHYGVDPLTLPQDDPRWMQFRADYVTQFIVELRRKLAVAVPERHIEISVYLSGDDPSPDAYLKGSLQDWRTWAKMGIVDTLHVAQYTRNFDEIYDAVQRVRGAVPDRTRINCFIAAYGGNLNTPQLLLKGVEAATAAGADEVTIYRGDAIDELQLWPTIKQAAEQYGK